MGQDESHGHARSEAHNLMERVSDGRMIAECDGLSVSFFFVSTNTTSTNTPSTLDSTRCASHLGSERELRHSRIQSTPVPFRIMRSHNACSIAPCDHLLKISVSSLDSFIRSFLRLVDNATMGLDKDLGEYRLVIVVQDDGVLCTATHKHLPDRIYSALIPSRNPESLRRSILGDEFQVALDDQDRVLVLGGAHEYRLNRRETLVDQVAAQGERIAALTREIADLRASSTDPVALREAMINARIEGTTQHEVVLRTGTDYNNALHTSTPSPGCLTVTFQGPVRVRAFDVRFYDQDGRTHTTTTEVSEDGNNWTTIERFVRGSSLDRVCVCAESRTRVTHERGWLGTSVEELNIEECR